MFTTLNIVIGLVFILLLFSLLTSTVLDVIASILSLKAKNLRYTLENMLGDKVDDFIQHPLFRQISYATNRRAKLSTYYLPDAVSKDTFTSILHDLMDAAHTDGLAEKINHLKDSDMKRMMQFMLRQSDGNLQAFKAQTERWYDEVMVRNSAWYKRTMKWWAFGVGFALAAILNADTIQMYQNISTNPVTQDMLMALATDYAERTDSVTGPTLNLTLEQAVGKVDSVLHEIDKVRSPIGLGWNSEEADRNLPWWLVKLAGLLITAIAVTFGAPFWYDLLKKLLPISVKSEKSPETVAPADVQPTPVQEVIVTKQPVKQKKTDGSIDQTEQNR
ncbi:MAG: hypothetical protein IT262_05925 [Saprospiraceae bacterium]|nr:hypothetical protein [Saprospiraceae bacterium]